jgi:hypothetical protein
VNVCRPKGKGYEKCGRETAEKGDKYPYCRPSVRVSEETPMTVDELIEKYGKNKIDELCRKKQKKGLPVEGKPSRISLDA